MYTLQKITLICIKQKNIFCDHTIISSVMFLVTYIFKEAKIVFDLEIKTLFVCHSQRVLEDMTIKYTKQLSQQLDLASVSY